jgi:uncharacterized phage protein (TIGR01671 family)
MNRTIKFRAWHKEAKEMLYPDNGKQSYVFYWLEEGQPVDIMQFTGLLDKNGKEIYEGDVYKCRIYSRTHGKWDRFIGVITYIGTSFRVVGVKQYSGISAELYANGEVIGNIYENPGLLE